MVSLNILHSSYDFFRERFLLEKSYPKSWVRFLLGTISSVYVFSSIQMNVCILCLLYKYTCSNIHVIFFYDFHFDQNVLNLEVWYCKVHAISFINSFFLYSYSFRIHWHKAGTYNFFPIKYSLMQKEVAYWICTLDFPCEKIKMRKRHSFD